MNLFERRYKNLLAFKLMIISLGDIVKKSHDINHNYIKEKFDFYISINTDFENIIKYVDDISMLNWENDITKFNEHFGENSFELISTNNNFDYNMHPNLRINIFDNIIRELRKSRKYKIFILLNHSNP